MGGQLQEISNFLDAAHFQHFGCHFFRIRHGDCFDGGLDLRQVMLDEQVLRVVGKGDKERIVPIVGTAASVPSRNCSVSAASPAASARVVSALPPASLTIA